MNTALSVIMVVKNEEKRIRRCLESVRWADEIVVVDQSSDDATVNICREYTDKVFSVPPKNFCEPDRQTAVSKVKNDWILYVDADEVVSPELKSEIISFLATGPVYGCCYIPRKNIFLGKWIMGSGWYPGYVLRLFRKGFVKFSNDIHADTSPLKESGYLKNHIIHYTCDDLGEYVAKSDRYISILAGQSYDKGDRISVKNFVWGLFILPAVYFLHRLILKAGLRDGWRGFLIALLTSRTIFMKNIRLWAVQKKCGR
ncbi:MAG: glycosyltransferase family 2 protein [Candidatus Omnitrophica bacterium]|nr:glycosyltransferase family 2 protein [Candidatus Omnitrophota bacterium]